MTITKNNAASAPATGAGSTSGVESSPFMNVLLVVDIVCLAVFPRKTYWIFAPDTFTTLAHFSMSFRR